MQRITFKDYVADFFQSNNSKHIPYGIIFLLALLMSLVKISFIPANETMTALWEETAIYLNGYHLPFGSFLFYPDAGYINFLPKFAAFLALRIFGLTAVYPFVLKFLCFFLSALAVLVFLSNRFSRFSASRTARLALCFFLFFFPDHDLFASYNASYYVVFLLAYYLLKMLDPQPFQQRDQLFIILTGFAAVWSKPVFFIFSLAFLLILIKFCLEAIRKSTTFDGLKIVSLAWILCLYGVQLFFTLHFYPDLGASGLSELTHRGNLSHQIFLLTKQGLIFLGYGLAAPLYALLPKFSSTVSLLFGVVVVGIMFSNFRFCFTKRLWDIILLNTTLLGCCIFGVYGILQSKWIYTCAFTDSLFQRAWDHRHLFPFIIFSNLQVLFLLGRTAWSRKILFSVGYCAMLTAISLCILHPMYQGAFFTYSLRWSEARKLLKEPYAAMPIPQLMPEWLPSHEFALPQAQTGPYDSRITGMFYSPQCNWGSGGVKASPVENGTAIQGIFAYRHFFAQPERKVKYLLLFPKPEEQVFLPKGTILSVEHGELTLKAELLNPGSRGYYLFVFDKLIPSKYTNEFTIMAPEGYPPQSDFTVFMMGFWG